MEQCFSGYCRALDGVARCDGRHGRRCCGLRFSGVLHAPVCKIAAELREFLGEMVEELRNRREKSEFSPDFRKNSGKTCKKD